MSCSHRRRNLHMYSVSFNWMTQIPSNPRFLAALLLRGGLVVGPQPEAGVGLVLNDVFYARACALCARKQMVHSVSPARHHRSRKSCATGTAGRTDDVTYIPACNCFLAPRRCRVTLRSRRTLLPCVGDFAQRCDGFWWRDISSLRERYP